MKRKSRQVRERGREGFRGDGCLPRCLMRGAREGSAVAALAKKRESNVLPPDGILPHSRASTVEVMEYKLLLMYSLCCKWSGRIQEQKGPRRENDTRGKVPRLRSEARARTVCSSLPALLHLDFSTFPATWMSCQVSNRMHSPWHAEDMMSVLGVCPSQPESTTAQSSNAATDTKPLNQPGGRTLDVLFD